MLFLLMKVFILFTYLQIAFSMVDRRVITSSKYSNYRVKPVIVNGEPVENSRVPYLVSIKNMNKRINIFKILWTNLCGGSIIGEDKVLSAAHCFEANNFYYASHPHKLRVVAGNVHTDVIHPGFTETSNEAQWRRVAKVVLHGDFIFPMHDIALVFVNRVWKYNQVVNYIHPAMRTGDYPNTCVSAGFGKVGYNPGQIESNVLLLAKIKVLTRWTCSVVWDMDMNTFICSSSEFGDVATGDSGGPLACHATLDPTEVEGKEILVGVVSGKNFDKTTLYTRVSAYHDWILSNSASKLTPIVLNIISLLLIYLLFLLKCKYSLKYSQLLLNDKKINDFVLWKQYRLFMQNSYFWKIQ
jgi:trypsin